MKELKRFKNLYDWMNQTGDLQKFMPKAKGVWDLDKDRFIKLQENMEKLANLIEYGDT
jgi:hypothetical protein